MRGTRYSGPERLSPKRILQGLDPEEPGEACLSRTFLGLLSCASILDLVDVMRKYARQLVMHVALNELLYTWLLSPIILQSGASVPLRVMFRKPPCDEFGQRTKPAKIGHVLFPLRIIVGFIVSASRNPWAPANHSTQYYTLSISVTFVP